mmetsp:Transcript_19853/g.33058  ORF Transcript_19853/g.33058 Transcript_19853/m.33058 type:complete len:89 (+) Transcript_19853:103-369(+)
MVCTTSIVSPLSIANVEDGVSKDILPDWSSNLLGLVKNIFQAKNIGTRVKKSDDKAGIKVTVNHVLLMCSCTQALLKVTVDAECHCHC